jgi:hypothetical protein
LVYEPLAHESIERRETNDRRRADDERRPRERHAPRETAELLHVASAGHSRHRTRAKEETLEHGVIDRVEQRARVADDSERRMIIRRPERPDTDAHRDNSHVLDAVIREQALDVVLRQGPQHAEHRRQQPDAEHGPTPPCRWGADQHRDP